MVDFLERGVLKFKRDGFRKNRAQFRKLAKSQSPRILFVTCADSRVLPALITQTRPGDLFVERNPGNIVPVYSRDARIVVCGHSDCGAVEGILHPEKITAVPAVKRWLTYGKRSRQMLMRRARELPEDRQLELLTQMNVIVQIEHLKTHPSVKRRLKLRKLALHGWVYRIQDGEILQLNQLTGEFLPWP